MHVCERPPRSWQPSSASGTQRQGVLCSDCTWQCHTRTPTHRSHCADFTKVTGRLTALGPRKFPTAPPPVILSMACRLALVDHYADVACRAAALHAAQNGAAAARVLDRAAPGVALAMELALEVRKRR